MLICWFVNRDYTQTTEQIFTKLGWKIGLGPEQNPLTFENFKLQDRAFFLDISPYFLWE